MEKESEGEACKADYATYNEATQKCHLKPISAVIHRTVPYVRKIRTVAVQTGRPAIKIQNHGITVSSVSFVSGAMVRLRCLQLFPCLHYLP